MKKDSQKNKSQEVKPPPAPAKTPLKKSARALANPSASPPAELFPDLAGKVPLSDDAFDTWASAERLHAITGLQDYELRNISREKNPVTNAPWFPAPVRSKYQVAATLRGLLARERHLAAHANKLPVFPSMEAMSAATRFEKSVLQSAKANGCPGFEYSRCDSAKIIPWINSNDSEFADNKNWTSHREKYDALISESKYRTMSGEQMAKTNASETSAAAVAIFFAALGTLFKEIPVRCAGRSAAEIKIYLENVEEENFRKPVEKQLETLEKEIDQQLQTAEQAQGELVKE